MTNQKKQFAEATVRDIRLAAFALTTLKDPYFHSRDENQSSFAVPVTFPS